MATHDDVNARDWMDRRLAALNPPEEWDPDTAHGLARLRQQRRVGVSQRRRRTWVAVTIGAILLLVIPTPAVRGFAHACGKFVRRTLSGADATHATGAVPRTLLTDTELGDVNGRTFTLSEYQGKVVLLTYWSTTCRQCQSEMTWFEEFQRTFGDGRFAVVGIAVDPGGADAVNRFLVNRPINYRVVLGDPAVARRHAAASIPTTFILDTSGRVAVRHVGFCSKREFESDIRTVLAEQ